MNGEPVATFFARTLMVAPVLCAVACSAPVPPEPVDMPSVSVDPHETTPVETEPTEPATVEPATEGPALALTPLRFAEGDMNLLILDRPHSTHVWERGGVLTQGLKLEEDYHLRVVVRVGEGEDLRHVPEFRPSVEFDPPQQMRLCDRPAQLLVGHSPARRIECIEFADGRPSRPGFDPAQTYVLVGFEHEGLGATAEWSVPTRYRELYGSLEEAFFAGLACPD